MVERAVYSLWTKPMDGEYVGFNSEQALMECFALSLHYSKKWFKEVHLVTDIKGKELVEKYGLEFTDINIDLENELKDIDNSYWSLGKIYACKIQDKPFVHIDNDVILFKELPQSFLNAEVGFQNLELHSFHTFYGNMINFDKKNYTTPPKWYRFPTNDEGVSYNCGLLLFNKISILQEWWNEATKYVNYLTAVGGYGTSAWDLPCIVFEQHFIASICKEYGIPVSFLTDYHTVAKIDLNFIDEFLAKKLGYTHLISECKRKPEVELKVRKRLALEGIEIPINK